jgi:hypothetical protein
MITPEHVFKRLTIYFLQLEEKQWHLSRQIFPSAR